MVFLTILLYLSPAFAQDKKEPVAVTDAIVPEMNIVDNKLYVKNAVGKRVQIITIIGNKVRELEIKSPLFEYDLNLPKAIYIFKMEGIVKKVVIK